MPLATVVLVIALVVVGLVARRAVRTARERGIALLVAALTAAVLVAVLAATLGFELEQEEGTLDYTFSAGTYFLVALTEFLLIGSFSFGFVTVWGEPFRTAARSAAVLFGVVFLLGTALFPGWIVAHDPAGGRGEPARLRDMALNSAWAPGAGTAALPLALGAKAHMETERFTSPFVSFTDEGVYRYLPGIARYTQRHESARLDGYAGAGGIGWKLLLISGSVLLVILWTLAGAWVVASMGAPRAIDGLRLGALVGVFGGLLVVVVSRIAYMRIETPETSLFWGVTGAASVQTAAELVVLTGIGGAVYAALRPAPRQFQAAPLVVPTWLWPGHEEAATAAPARSGAQAEEDEAGDDEGNAGPLGDTGPLVQKDDPGHDRDD
jgi:hypothetical protein